MKASALRRAVERTLERCPFDVEGTTLVCGLSGGADSVTLLDALTALARTRGFRVVAAHLDHGLRPDSALDAEFCAALSRRLGVPFETARADVAGRARRLHEGLEAAAREERYAFLRAVRERAGARAIAVAHTRDDQAETVLMRLLRGAGGPGLAAMRPVSGDIVRPLLSLSRAEVLDYLAERGLTWREDPSNADRSILRNRVRHELLPQLERELNPRLRARLATTAALLQDESDLLDALAGDLLESAARATPSGVLVSRAAFTQAPRALARRAVRLACERAGAARGLAAVHVERILALAGAARPSGRRLPLPGGREVACHFDELCFGPRVETPATLALPLPVPGQVELPSGWTVSTAACTDGPDAAAVRAHVGKEEAAELMVRTRRAGDRVRVGQREISLKRFFCQRRVPFSLRAGLPLIAVGPRVLWMPGQRLEAGTCGPHQVHVCVRPTTDAALAVAGQATLAHGGA